MFLTLWHYWKGYVIVEVCGNELDRFIRMMMNRQIVMRNVAKRGNKIYISTTTEGFKKMCQATQKANCKVHIVEKKGLPFLLFRYRKRKLFGIGAIIFILSMYILSSFVWVIDVTGNDAIETAEVIKVLQDEGYTTGKFKKKLDLRNAEKILMRAYPQITWTGIEFQGTQMLVQVAEAVKPPKIMKNDVPCDLIAKNDGLITYIATEQGLPQVKAGDIVKKDDVLVKGAIPFTDESGRVYLTESIATIKAKTGYSLKGTLDLTKTVKNYTDEVATSYNLKIFQTKIPLFNSKKTYEQYDTLVTTNQMSITKLLPLPFYFEKTQKVEYVEDIETISESDAKDQLLMELYEHARTIIGEDAKILKQEINYELEDDNKMTATFNIMAEENIAVDKALTIEEITSESKVDTTGNR
ncbi:MAG: sporulation protein YqfD [Cellulosilyticaceae bacterium]